jgi:hypothetical protein
MSNESSAASVTDEHLFLEIRTRDGRLLSQWAIPVGEDASEIDVNAEFAWLRAPYRVGDQLPCDTNADALLRGDT